MKYILLKILAGRKAEDLTCSEARRVVNEFYNQIAFATLGATNQKQIEYKSRVVLESENLGYFAV